jgi:glycosyltransferase involved in cell wall biosynthesis
MRVCLVTETFYPVVGGGETQARLLAEDLASHGFEVMIVTRRSDRALPEVERMARFTIRRIPPVGSGPLVRWRMLVFCFLALLKLRDEYDIVFVSGYKALGVAAVLIGKLFRKPCILKADSNGEMSGAFFAGGLKKVGFAPSSFGVRLFLSARNAILRGADRFVAISSDIGAELAQNGVPGSRIDTITNSVDTSRFFPVDARRKHELRRTLGIPNDYTVVAFTGRLVSYKGLPLLLRVWNDICRQRSDMLLVLIGSGGLDMHNCEAELRAYVRSQGLQERVVFTGDVRNVDEYLQMSDIFVFPTEKEAFPLALIEAMACGLPVITTPVGGIKDILAHGKNGLLVEPGDAQQLSHALQTLGADIAQRTRLGAAAMASVQARYTRVMVAEKYIALFRQLLA